VKDTKKEFAKALWAAVVQAMPASTTRDDFEQWLTAFMETEGWQVTKVN